MSGQLLQCCTFGPAQATRPHFLYCKQPPHHALLPSRSILHLSASKYIAGAPTVAVTQTEPGNDIGGSVDGAGDDLHPGAPEPKYTNKLRRRVQLKELARPPPPSPSPSPSPLSASLSSARMRGVLLLNLLTFLYGSNIPIIKEVEATVNPTLFLCGRFAFATMVMSPFIVSGIKDCEVRKASLELGLWISMGYWTQSISLLSTDAGRASFISAFTVIVVPLLAGLTGRDIPKVTWASALMAFVGVGLLETSGSPATLGDLWSLLSAVLFGVHMIRTEHYSRAMPSRMLLPMLGMQLLVITLSSILWSYVASFLFQGLSFPGLIFTQLGVQAAWESMLHFPWLPLIYTGTISTAFCLWIELTAMRDISATDTAVIYSLEPLWGAAFAWCFLGERWGAKGWLGAFLILGGSLAVQLSQATENEAEG